MYQKSVGGSTKEKYMKEGFSYLPQLSISSIKQKGSVDVSLDFDHQKQLLNQFQSSQIQPSDEYGLKSSIRPKPFAKKVLQVDNQPKRSNIDNPLNLRSIQKQQKNLCFNKQLKRKKTASKSKQKTIQSLSLLGSNKSLKHIIHDKSSKQLHTEELTTAARNNITIKINNIKKTPPLALKIIELPIPFSHFSQSNSICKKIYQRPPSDLKAELNDFNFNFEPTFCTSEPETKSTLRKQAKSFTNIQWSRLSNNSKMFFTSEESSTNDKNPNKVNQQPNKVVEVSRHKSIDFKNSSLFSSRTEQFESPLSKDSTSTATHRIIRRSEIFPNSQKNIYDYFTQPSIAYKCKNTQNK